MKRNQTFNHLRQIAQIVVAVGGVSSLVFVILAGQNNKSIMLRVLFIGWVLSPFIALLVANVFSKYWSFFNRKTLYIIMIIIPLASLVCYTGVLSQPGTKPAAVFLIVPLISWLLMVIIIPIIATLSRKKV